MKSMRINCANGTAELVELSADEVATREAERAAYVEPEAQAAQIFTIPVIAPDFIVASPRVKDNPLDALNEAIAEAGKAHGESKSIALITLSLTRYLQDVEERLKKAKI